MMRSCTDRKKSKICMSTTGKTTRRWTSMATKILIISRHCLVRSMPTRRSWIFAGDSKRCWIPRFSGGWISSTTAKKRQKRFISASAIFQKNPEDSRWSMTGVPRFPACFMTTTKEKLTMMPRQDAWRAKYFPNGSTRSVAGR